MERQGGLAGNETNCAKYKNKIKDFASSGSEDKIDEEEPSK
jgi:hypothetical protein